MNRMTFGMYTFPYNPESLKISHSRRVITRFSPFCGSMTEDYGAEAVHVSGEGEFLGRTAETELETLIREFKAGGKRNLVVGGELFPAYFENLTVIRGTESEAVRFHFEFIEAPALQG